MVASKPQARFPWHATEGREDRQNRQTIPILFREIERRFAFGGRFNLDACAEEWNHKVPRVKEGDRVISWYFDLEEDGLIQPWRLPDGTPGRVYCNPEWNNIEPWIQKAKREVFETCHAEQVVFCVPARLDREWHHFAARWAARIEAIMGRPHYPQSGGKEDSNQPFEATYLIDFHRPIHWPLE